MKNLWIAALAAVLLVSCGGRESQNRNKQTTKTEKKMGVQHLTKAEFLTKVANYEASPKEWKLSAGQLKPMRCRLRHGK